MRIHVYILLLLLLIIICIMRCHATLHRFCLLSCARDESGWAVVSTGWIKAKVTHPIHGKMPHGSQLSLEMHPPTDFLRHDCASRGVYNTV